MFSKILEIFITELTMRSWLHTEESKRRTVQVSLPSSPFLPIPPFAHTHAYQAVSRLLAQRSDIAMAITKNDMFDFLIDIVPREEIQLKTKSQKVKKF